ncbi:hypothetical protein [Niallia sp.]|uniref:hypothetical protein n=1 Tax=Niallia sp. TaxID=2837523 RepID=UPI0028990EDF|nr:hypothetical protein [Niallia sp.]
MNIGEEIVASYLEYIKECDFVQKNLYTKDVQGEIDVVGINLKTNEAYVCESTTHLTTGLLYVGRDYKNNNIQKLVDKFSKDIDYAEKYLPDYQKHYMLWSPIVKDNKTTRDNSQIYQLNVVKGMLYDKYKINLELIINESYQDCLTALRAYARKETKALQSPILRYMQIEEYLSKHISNLNKYKES